MNFSLKAHILTPLLLLLALGLTLFVVLPAAQSNWQMRQNIAEEKRVVERLEALSGHIRRLELSLSDEQKKGAGESMLKQVERLARESGVFEKIARVSPVRGKGKQGEGLALELENTSMAELAPFLEAVTQRSLLSLTTMELTRAGEVEGVISARLTLLRDI